MIGEQLIYIFSSSSEIDFISLTLHHSTKVKNERTACSEEWFALVFFIHGKMNS
jgi:hypothetical protein